MLKRLRERKGRSKGTKEFIDILKLHNDYPSFKVQMAVKKSAVNGAWNYESVKQLIQTDNYKEQKSQFLDRSQLPAMIDFKIEPPDLSRYNQLIGQGEAS